MSTSIGPGFGSLFTSSVLCTVAGVGAGLWSYFRRQRNSRKCRKGRINKALSVGVTTALTVVCGAEFVRDPKTVPLLLPVSALAMGLVVEADAEENERESCETPSS